MDETQSEPLELETNVEPPAVAVTGPMGVEYASPAFLEAVGLGGARVAGSALEVLLSRQGFVARGDGRYVREGVWVLTSRAGGATLAWVEDPDVRRRRARLLRSAAHDLRGPVANIRSFLSLLKVQDVQLPPRATRALEVIQRSADRALSLMQEFFTSEQAHAGVLELPVDPTELSPLIVKAVEHARAATQERAIPIRTEELGELPPVLVEPMALQHVVQVMLEWCVARTPGSAPEDVDEDRRAPTKPSSVQLRAWREGEALVLAADGDGPRLSAEEQASLFDREYWLAREGKLLLGFRLSVAAAEAAAMGARLDALGPEHAANGRAGLALRIRLASA